MAPDRLRAAIILWLTVLSSSSFAQTYTNDDIASYVARIAGWEIPKDSATDFANHYWTELDYKVVIDGQVMTITSTLFSTRKENATSAQICSQGTIQKEVTTFDVRDVQPTTTLVHETSDPFSWDVDFKTKSTLTLIRRELSVSPPDCPPAGAKWDASLGMDHLAGFTVRFKDQGQATHFQQMITSVWQ